MISLAHHKENTGHKVAALKVLRLIKFHNPTSLLGIEGEDVTDLVNNLQRDYSLEIVERAAAQLEKSSDNKSLTIGTFLEKCHEFGAEEKRHKSFIDVTRSPQKASKEVAQKNLAVIKKMLGKCVKPLPYNKNSRVV